MSDEALTKEDKEREERLQIPGATATIIKFTNDLICLESMEQMCSNTSCRLHYDIESTEMFLLAKQEGEKVKTILCPLSFREKGSKGSKPRLGYGRIL